MFDIGDTIDNCQKLNIIIGKVSVSADIVRVNAVLTSNILVRKEKSFS